MTRTERREAKERREDCAWRIEKELEEAEKELQEAIKEGGCGFIRAVRKRDELRQRLRCLERKGDKRDGVGCGLDMSGREIDEMFNR